MGEVTGTRSVHAFAGAVKNREPLPFDAPPPLW
jgi:hypothetical protein